MPENEIDHKKLAKEIEDFKTSKKAANLYWGFIIVMPILMTGFNPISYVISLILILLSFSMKTRKIAYFLAVIPIPIYAFFIGGFVGALIGLVPAVIMALICAANYAHYLEVKRIA